MNDPDLLPTERIDVDDTLVEDGDWGEDTEVGIVPAPPPRSILARLARAGVRSRSSAERASEGPNRRWDSESAARFDEALDRLEAGDLDGALQVFTTLLEQRPSSTRLWIYVRAISSAQAVGG